MFSLQQSLPSFRLSLFQNAIERNPLDCPSAHGGPDVTFEALPVASEVFSRVLVQRVRGVGLEEKELRRHEVVWLAFSDSSCFTLCHCSRIELRVF